MYGTNAFSEYAYGEDATTNTAPPTSTIDATKVPASRTVVFGGDIRVVSFYGSNRTVSF